VLEDALSGVLETAKALIVDVSETTFLDSSAINTLFPRPAAARRDRSADVAPVPARAARLSPLQQRQKAGDSTFGLGSSGSWHARPSSEGTRRQTATALTA
jgi:hypothetical protein